MTALQHEIAASQVMLFQRTGKLLEIAEEVRKERETLVRLLKLAEQDRGQDLQREGKTDDR